MGAYTSRADGGSALIVKQEAGALTVLQKLTLAHMPVVVSDTVSNGWKEIVVPYSGGGAEPACVVLRAENGICPSVADGAAIDSLEGVSGTAVLYTDGTAPDVPVLTLAG
ncbi:MAG: hypothetical protein ACOX67_07580 [Oscillospiraceae bacterium]|jgi:hypothetical protein